MKDYKISPNKAFICATNMINGVTNAGLTHLSCYLHTLHLLLPSPLFVNLGNSAVQMLKVFQNLKPRLVVYLTNSELCETLTKPEWAKLDLVVKVLEPLEHVSNM